MSLCKRCQGPMLAENLVQVCGKCFNAGDYYEESRLEADLIRANLEVALATKDVKLIKKLTRELEMALYVGD